MGYVDNQETFCSGAAMRVGPERKVAAGLSTTLPPAALHYRNVTVLGLSTTVVFPVRATQP